MNFLRAWIREHFDGVEDEFEIVLEGTDQAPELRLALGLFREARRLPRGRRLVILFRPAYLNAARDALLGGANDAR